MLRKFGMLSIGLMLRRDCKMQEEIELENQIGKLSFGTSKTSNLNN